MAEYNKAKIIKYSRLFNKMTQEKLAEEICEPETINRYESGVLDPSHFNYYLIMRKLGEHADVYRIPGDFVSFELINLKNQIKQLIELGRFDAIVDCNKGVISREECIKKLVDILQISCPDFSFDYINSYIPRLLC